MTDKEPFRDWLPTVDAEAYLEWRRDVDAVIRRRTGGFAASDFPDYAFRDAFRDEQTPEQVVDAILSGEGWTDA